MHPAPIGTKDQKIHSGQFSTKVLLPFASWVMTLSIPYLKRIAEKTMLRTVIRITDGFFSFSGKRSVNSDRLTSSPFRHASAAARSVMRTNTATTSSSVNDHERWITLRENTFPTVSTRISSVDMISTTSSTAASTFMSFL